MGRGRGRLPQQPAVVEPLRRPAIASMGRGIASQSVEPPSYSSLSTQKSAAFTQVQSALSNQHTNTVTFFSALDKFLSESPTDEQIKALIKEIFDKVVQGPVNYDCISKCIFIASKNLLKGDSLLNFFFNELQKRFEGAYDIKKNYGSSGYWRFVSFFSSICHYTRNITLPPFPELVDAIYKLIVPEVNTIDQEYLNILVTALVRYSYYKKMANISSNSYIEAANLLRLLLIERHSQFSEIGVSWLMLGIELCSNPTEKNEPLLFFYKKVLGQEVFSVSLEVPPVQMPSESKQRFDFSKVAYSICFV